MAHPMQTAFNPQPLKPPATTSTHHIHSGSTEQQKPPQQQHRAAGVVRNLLPGLLQTHTIGERTEPPSSRHFSPPNSLAPQLYIHRSGPPTASHTPQHTPHPVHLLGHIAVRLTSSACCSCCRRGTCGTQSDTRPRPPSRSPDTAPPGSKPHSKSAPRHQHSSTHACAAQHPCCPRQRCNRYGRLAKASHPPHITRVL